jgi:hypothetical protein
MMLGWMWIGWLTFLAVMGTAGWIAGRAARREQQKRDA